MIDNQLRITVETITPVVAQTMLASNQSNRTVSRKTIARYADAMRSGYWPLNGDTIVFASSGRLLNGQHRLSACIEADSPFTTIVVRGVHEGVFPTYDIGKARKGKDVCIGEPNPAVMGRLLTLVWRNDNNALGDKLRYPDNTQRYSVKVKYPELTQAVEFGMTMRGIMSPSLAAFLFWIFRKIDGEATFAFFEQLKTGANLLEDSPVLRYREYLLTRYKKRVQHNTDEDVALGIKALNAHIEGRGIRLLKMTKREEFPSTTRHWQAA